MSNWYDDIPGELPRGGAAVAERPVPKSANWYDDIPGELPRQQPLTAGSEMTAPTMPPAGIQDRSDWLRRLGVPVAPTSGTGPEWQDHAQKTPEAAPVQPLPISAPQTTPAPQQTTTAAVGPVSSWSTSPEQQEASRRSELAAMGLSADSPIQYGTAATLFPSRTWSVDDLEALKAANGPGTRLRDVGITAAKGVAGLGQAIVGLADFIAPDIRSPAMKQRAAEEGSSPGGMLHSAAQSLDDAQKWLHEQYSPETKQAYANVSEAKGFLNKIGAALKNPSTIVASVAESIPSMLAGGLIGKGLGVLGKAGSLLSKYGFAAGEGVVTAGSIQGQTLAESPTGSTTLGQKGLALTGGAFTGLISALSGKVASQLGIDDIEKLLAGTVSTEIKQNVITRAIARALASDKIAARAAGKAAQVGLGFTQEGMEELVQSTQEQIAGNLAQDKPWYEGLDEAAVMGLLTGGVMGGGTQLHPVSRSQISRTQARAMGMPEDVVRTNPDTRAEWVKEHPEEAQRAIVEAVIRGTLTSEKAVTLLAGLQPYLTPGQTAKESAAPAPSAEQTPKITPLSKLAPDVTQEEMDWIAEKEGKFTRDWLQRINAAMEKGNPHPYEHQDMTAEEFASKSPKEQNEIRDLEVGSRMSIRDILEKIRAHREALDVQSKTAFATREGDDTGTLTRDVNVSGEKKGETVTYPGTEADRQTVERVFPGIVGNAPVWRFHGIWLDESVRGKGLGQKMFLDAMAQNPDAWFYNSQLEPPATKALAALREKGLVETRYRSGSNVWSDTPEGNLGSWMARLTDKGREYLGLPVSQGEGNAQQEQGPTTPNAGSGPRVEETGRGRPVEESGQGVRPSGPEGGPVEEVQGQVATSEGETVLGLGETQGAPKPAAEAAPAQDQYFADDKQKPRPEYGGASQQDVDDAVVAMRIGRGREVSSRFPQTEHENEIADFLRSRNRKFAFVDTDKPGFAGAWQPLPNGNGVMLINGSYKGRGGDLWFVVGHELAHQSGLDALLPSDSDLMQERRNHVLQRSPKDLRKEYQDNPELLDKEVRADFVGEFLRNADFRAELQRTNPTLWQRLRDFLLRMIGHWTPHDEAKKAVLNELRLSASTAEASQQTQPAAATEAAAPATEQQQPPPRKVTGLKAVEPAAAESDAGQSELDAIFGMQDEEPQAAESGSKQLYPSPLPASDVSSRTASAVEERTNVDDITLRLVGLEDLPLNANGHANIAPIMRIKNGKFIFEEPKYIKVYSGLSADEKLRVTAHELGHRYTLRRWTPLTTALAKDSAKAELDTFRTRPMKYVERYTTQHKWNQTQADHFVFDESIADAIGSWLIDKDSFSQTFPVLSATFDAHLIWRDVRKMIPSVRQVGQTSTAAATRHGGNARETTAVPEPATTQEVGKVVETPPPSAASGQGEGKADTAPPPTPTEAGVTAEAPPPASSTEADTKPSPVEPTKEHIAIAATVEAKFRRSRMNDQADEVNSALGWLAVNKPELFAPGSEGQLHTAIRNRALTQFREANKGAVPSGKAKVGAEDVAAPTATEPTETEQAVEDAKPFEKKAMEELRDTDPNLHAALEAFSNGSFAEVAKAIGKSKATAQEWVKNGEAKLAEIIARMQKDAAGETGQKQGATKAPETPLPPMTDAERRTEAIAAGIEPFDGPDAETVKAFEDLEAERKAGHTKTPPTGKLRTLSGREIEPPPQKSTKTARGVKSNVLAVDRWLVEQGIAEAEAKGDDFNGDQFRRIDPKRITPAERDGLNLYLFGKEESQLPRERSYGTLEAPDRVALGEHFSEQLEAGKAYPSILEARQEAGRLLGGEVKPGSLAAKHVDEAVEQGVVRAARKIVASGKSPQEIYRQLQDLYARQPNLAVRTSTSMQQQAYSTPAPLAYLASHLAGVEADTRTYDATAGNGMLLIGADAANAVANELNADRAASLKGQGIATTQHDATTFDPGEKFPAIILNPPFGKVTGENGSEKTWTIDGLTTNQVDHAIALQGLHSLADDGRAVLILGAKGRDANTPLETAKAYSGAGKPFYKHLYDRYNVVDHFTVSGDLYSRQGAKFPVDVIVIDGRGKSDRPLPWNINEGGVPKVYQTWEDLGNDKLGNVAPSTLRTAKGVDAGAWGSPGSAAASERQEADVGDVSRPAQKPGQVDDGPDREPSTGLRKPLVRRRIRDRGSRRGPKSSGPSGQPGIHEPSGKSVQSDTEQVSKGSEARQDSHRGDSDSGQSGRLADAPAARSGEITPKPSLDNISEEDLAKDIASILMGESQRQEPEASKPRESETRESEPKTTPSKKIVSAAEQARIEAQEAEDALDRALRARGLAMNRVFDPELILAAANYTAKKVKAGVLSFSEFVSGIVTRWGEPAARKLSQLFERAWEIVRTKYAPKGMEPAGKVDDILNRQQKKPSASESEFQVTYYPKSAHESVDTLLPRNHEEAVKRSLDNIENLYGDIDEFVASELGWSPGRMKNLSAEQVDAIAMAIHSHKNKSGFIIGDQTGVGKGRVVASMIDYAKTQGMIPVFVTKDSGLFADMMRDMMDVEMSTAQRPFEILATNDTTGEREVLLPDGRVLSSNPKTNERLVREAIRNWENGKGLTAAGKTYDAIFTTYSQLQPVAGNPAWREVVLNQIAAKSYFFLDESHEAVGTSKSGGRKKKDEPTHSGRALTTRNLIRDAAGVFYSSATFAKRPDAMDLYSRTSMARAVKRIEDLAAAIGEGGVPLQQVVSEMLTEAGEYLRRERSYKDIKEFRTERVPADLDKADKVNEIFRAINVFDKLKEKVKDEMQADIVSAGGKIGKDSATGEAGIKSTNFSSIMWNLVDQMLFSLKADAAAAAAIESFNKGESPFLVVDNTMEESLKRAIAEAGATVGGKIEYSFKNLLERYLTRSRELLIIDDLGNPTQHWITDEELSRVTNALESYNAAKSLIDNLEIDLPASPIDWIRNKLEKAGLRVAEVTGRENMVKYEDDGTITVAERPKEEMGTAGKQRSVSAYNNGSIDAIIVNRSGSTGLSAHASAKFANQKVRRMILAQAAKNIDEFMQILGRVNRTKQVVAPAYTLLMTDAPAENRPGAVLVKKLASLNANVTGAASGAVSFDVPDIMNEVGDKIVAEYLSNDADLRNALTHKFPMKGASVIASDGLARQVTGYLNLLPNAIQEEFWNEVTRLYNQEIDHLNSIGENPLVAQVVPLDAKTKERLKIFDGQEDSTNPFDQPAYLERVDAKVQGRPWKSEKVAETLLKAYPEATSIDDVNPSRWSSQQVAELQKAGVEYANTATEGVTDEQRANLREQFQDQFGKVSEAMRQFAPGTSCVWFPTPGSEIQGIVTKFARHGKAKNPLAPSTWVVEVAVIDPIGKVFIPVSRLYGDNVISLARDYERTNARIAQFDSAVTQSREERWVATGNLLAAHSTLKGQNGRIAFFTDTEGKQRRGVLMPRSFKGEAWQESRPVVFENPHKALQFLQEGGLGLSSPDTELSVLLVGNNLVLRAPKARSRGGKYTTNQGILDAAAPAEFVSRGNIMELIVPVSKARDVLKATIELTPIQANVDRDIARQILEQDTPQTKPKPPKASMMEIRDDTQGPKSRTFEGLNQKQVAALGDVMANPTKYGTFDAFSKAMKKTWGAKWNEDWIPGLREMWDERRPPAKEAAPTTTVEAEQAKDEVPPTHPEKAAEEATLPDDKDLTGIKKAVVNDLRALVGLPEMEGSTPQTVEEWAERARATLAADPKAAIRLVNELATHPRAINERDAMLLQFRYRQLANELEPAVNEYMAAVRSEDPVAISVARTAVLNARSAMTEFEETIHPSKSTWGRTGVALQQLMRKDFSLEAILRRGHEANHGEELSEKQVSELTKLATQLKDLQGRFDELTKKNEELARELASKQQHEAALEEAKKSRRQPRSTTRQAAEKRLSAAWAKLKALLPIEALRVEKASMMATQEEGDKTPKKGAEGKGTAAGTSAELFNNAVEVAKAFVNVYQGNVRFGEFMAHLRTHLKEPNEAMFRKAWDQAVAAENVVVPTTDITDRAALTKEARAIQRRLFEAGMTDRDAIIDAVHEIMSEDAPELTRRMTMDALGRYGQFTVPSQLDIDKSLREMNAEILKLSQIDQQEIALKRVDELRKQGKSDEEIGNILQQEKLLVEATGLVRDKPLDTLRNLTKLYNQNKKGIPATTEGRAGLLQSAISSIERGLENRINDLNYEIENGPVVREKRERPTSDRIKELEAERDRLVAIHREMFPPTKKQLTDEQRLANAIKAAERTEALLQKQLQTRNLDQPDKRTKVSSAELDAIRARIEQFRAQIEAAKQVELSQWEAEGGAVAEDPGPARARRIYEASLRKRIADYKQILASGDFSPKPKKAPRELSASELKLKREMEDIRHQVLQKFAEYNLAHLHGIAWLGDKIAETAHLSRALMTSFDLSALLRQGGLPAMAHPILAQRALTATIASIAHTFDKGELFNTKDFQWDKLGQFLSGIDSRQAEFDFMHKINSGPNGEFRLQAGLSLSSSDQQITHQEEVFQGRWGQYVPGLSVSSHLYTMILNKMRADLFDLMVENLGRNGNVSMDEAKLIANFVNVSTGRSSPLMWKKRDITAMLNLVFFAPRYVASRFQYLAMPFYLPFKGGISKNWRAKRAIYKEYARTATGIGLVLGTIALASQLFRGGDDDDNAEIETDPRSSDFLKVRFGETRLDFLAGLSQTAVLSSRFALGSTKSSVSGKVRELGDPHQYKPDTRLSILANFARTKLAPVPGTVATIANDWTDVVGQKQTPGSLAASTVTPLSLRDIGDTIRAQGIPLGTAMSLLSVLGVGMNTYGPKTKFQTGTPEEREEMIRKDLKRMTREDHKLPAYSEFLTSAQLAKFRNRQEELLLREPREPSRSNGRRR